MSSSDSDLLKHNWQQICSKCFIHQVFFITQRIAEKGPWNKTSKATIVASHCQSLHRLFPSKQLVSRRLCSALEPATEAWADNTDQKHTSNTSVCLFFCECTVCWVNLITWWYEEGALSVTVCVYMYVFVWMSTLQFNIFEFGPLLRYYHKRCPAAFRSHSRCKLNCPKILISNWKASEIMVM